jgi:hypothetical protein
MKNIETISTELSQAEMIQTQGGYGGWLIDKIIELRMKLEEYFQEMREELHLQ